MISLMAEAIKFKAELGWNVIPTKIDKRPRCSWKRWQTKRQSRYDVERLFSSPGDGIAVVCGSVSGGLACRDFDKEKSYHAWASEFPKLANSLATSRTRRGYHVFYRSNREDYQTLGDGEIRASNRVYCVLPPSLAPGEIRYSWIIPPIAGRNGTVPFLDARKAGLTRRWDGLPEEGVTQLVFEPMSARLGGFPDSHCLSGYGIPLFTSDTIPSQYGQRNTKLLNLTRRLRTRCPDADPNSLEPILREWHSLALPFIRTKEFEVSWADFLSAWKTCKPTFGATSLPELAMTMTDTLDVPLPSEGLRDMAVLCYRMSRLTNGTFYLSTRDAAEVLGITGNSSQVKAWRLLNRLVDAGLIERLDRGEPGKVGGKAALFRWK